MFKESHFMCQFSITFSLTPVEPIYWNNQDSFCSSLNLFYYSKCVPFMTSAQMMIIIETWNLNNIVSVSMVTVLRYNNYIHHVGNRKINIGVFCRTVVGEQDVFFIFPWAHEGRPCYVFSSELFGKFMS